MLVEQQIKSHTLKNESLDILIEKYTQNTCTAQEKKIVEEYFEYCQQKEISLSDSRAVIGKRMYDKITSEISLRKRTTRKKRDKLVLKVAASILLIASVGVYVFSVNKIEKFTNLAKLGEKKEVTLPDGSVITLNSGSKLSYTSEFNNKFREVDLQGEAYFQVQSNSEKPFMVHTKDIKTTVIGTEFNINAYNENPQIVVSVASGKVNISNGDRLNEDLIRDQSLTYKPLDKSHIKAKSNSDYATAWKNNILLLDNMDLEATAKILEKWFDISIKVDNPLKSKIIYGTFNDPRLDEVLASLEFSIGIKVENPRVKHYLFKNPIGDESIQH